MKRLAINTIYGAETSDPFENLKMFLKCKILSLEEKNSFEKKIEKLKTKFGNKRIASYYSLFKMWNDIPSKNRSPIGSTRKERYYSFDLKRIGKFVKIYDNALRTIRETELFQNLLQLSFEEPDLLQNFLRFFLQELEIQEHERGDDKQEQKIEELYKFKSDCIKIREPQPLNAADEVAQEDNFSLNDDIEQLLIISCFIEKVNSLIQGQTSQGQYLDY